VSDYAINFPLLIGLVGGVIVLIMWVKSALDRIGLPHLLGYLGLGFGLRIADYQFGFLNSGFQEVFAFLGKIGLITLLFRIGLESRVDMLLGQLRRASLVWLGDIFISGLLGFNSRFLSFGIEPDYKLDHRYRPHRNKRRDLGSGLGEYERPKNA
jgi:Kef-type K+ transport system membrane component KefB